MADEKQALPGVSPAKPILETPKPTKPTGHQLLLHLEQTGTGADRRKLVEDWLKQHHNAPGDETLEWMIASGIPAGTLVKAGEFIHGLSFRLETGGATATDEVKAAKGQVRELERALREQAALLAGALGENRALRARLARLAEEGITDGTHIPNEARKQLNQEQLNQEQREQREQRQPAMAGAKR